MRIVLDDYPKNSIPFDVVDYSSALICSMLYEPLFIKKNDCFFENLVKDLSKCKQIVLDFKEFYWSNGEQCTPKDFKDTLFYIIKNRLPLSQSLDFIEGVRDYLDGEKDNLDDIGITVKNNRIYITSLIKSDYYKYLFSTIYFVPVKFIDGEPTSDISYGYFQKDSTDCLLKFRSNKYHRNYKEEKVLSFIIDDKPHNNINYFFSSKVDITSTTIFRRKDILKFKDLRSYRSLNSNLMLRIEFKEDLKDLKEILENSIRNFLKENSDVLDDIDIVDKLEMGILEDKIDNFKYKKEIKILFSDYYPNNLISKGLISTLNTMGMTTKIIFGEMDFYLNEYYDNNYDICIHVVSPVTQHEIDYYMEKMNHIDSCYIEEYINLLNKWFHNNLSNNSLDNFLKKHGLFIEIGRLKHRYLISDRASSVLFDDNGLFICGW